MAIFDTFTKRKKQAARAGQPVKWEYDNVPRELRTQVVYILVEALGGYREPQRYDMYDPPRSNQRWEFIRNTVARERGVFTLTNERDNPLQQCMNLLMTGTGDDALEIIEMGFRYVDAVMRSYSDGSGRVKGSRRPPTRRSTS
jgi:hypothetical protein